MTVSILHEWAAEEGITAEQLDRLHRKLGMLGASVIDDRLSQGSSESAVTSIFRLQVSAQGHRYWRNNSGALPDKTGRLVRYGLGNDSSRVNAVLKSSDWVGVERHLITPQMVGTYGGFFGSVELKRAGWRYTGDERERAQLNFITLVNSLGGRARFFSGEAPYNL